MQFKESDRLWMRRFAIDLRVAELDHELHEAQIRVLHLESKFEDARMALLLGEEAGNPSEIGSELERSHGHLESQREFVARVKKSQWRARVEHALVRSKERRAERELAAPMALNEASEQ